MGILINRRGFISGLICAPAIIRVAPIMPIRVWTEPKLWTVYGVYKDCDSLAEIITTGRNLEEVMPAILSRRREDVWVFGSSICHIDADLRKVVLAVCDGQT